MMRRARLIGFGLLGTGAIVMLVVVLATADQTSSDTSRNGYLPRDAGFDICRIAARRLPAGFVERDRTRRNLGNSTMGQSIAFGALRRSVQVHIGYDALDAAEDLDMVHVRTVPIRDREVDVFRAKAIPSILAATWEEEGIVAPCSDVTVFARRLTEQELLDVVTGVRAAGP
jgi:hypothetical protein